jgi:hypothetical protein
MINSDFGIPILVMIPYAFHLCQFTFLVTVSKHFGSMADFDEEPLYSFRQVMMNFCICCTYILKVMGIAVSCHTASSSTSTAVQKLGVVSQSALRFTSLAELQLFSLKCRNIGSRCTQPESVKQRDWSCRYI